jgi:two-component system cell cycle response regulator
MRGDPSASVRPIPFVDQAFAREYKRLESGVDHWMLAAHLDQLTQIGNQAASMGVMTVEFDRTSTMGRWMTLLVVDIDFFKQVNDAHGHLAGDTVIRQVADRLKAVCPEGAFVGRVGGDEFVIVMPNCAPDDGKRLAELLRLGIETAPFRVPDGALVPMTVSIGLVSSQGASGKDAGDGAKALYAVADQRLYESKMAGRNRVTSTVWP